MLVSATGAAPAIVPASAAQTPRDAANPSSTLPGLPPLQMIQGADLPAATAAFAAEVGKLFRQHGISVPPEVVLGNDAQGRITVMNDHPDKARIETLFADDFDLHNHYMQLASAHQLQRAVEGYDEFVAHHQRLQGDPQAQAALVEGRIARNTAPFFMSLGTQGAETFFGGVRLAV